MLLPFPCSKHVQIKHDKIKQKMTKRFLRVNLNQCYGLKFETFGKKFIVCLREKLFKLYSTVLLLDACFIFLKKKSLLDSIVSELWLKA